MVMNTQLESELSYNCKKKTDKQSVKFALKIEPENQALKDLADYTHTNKRTVGVYTIADELKHNPFMRLHEKAVQDATGESAPIEVMARLREMKNKG